MTSCEVDSVLQGVGVLEGKGSTGACTSQSNRRKTPKRTWSSPKAPERAVEFSEWRVDACCERNGSRCDASPTRTIRSLRIMDSSRGPPNIANSSHSSGASITSRRSDEKCYDASSQLPRLFRTYTSYAPDNDALLAPSAPSAPSSPCCHALPAPQPSSRSQIAHCPAHSCIYNSYACARSTTQEVYQAKGARPFPAE